MSTEPTIDEVTSEWWTPAELASRWKVSAREVQRMASQGQIAHFRAGRQIRIRDATVVAYEQAHTRHARSQRSGR